MTASQMFKLAHSQSKEDKAFDSYYSYAYYFKLRLLVLQANAREARTGMVVGFQIIEPRRAWA